MEANYKINVTIVGNSLIFRNGLKMLIENEKAFKVIDEAATLTEALASIGKYKPDVLLVDSSEIENTDAEAFFSECCDDIATLILTNSTDPVQHQNYLLLGVNGVVTKDQGAEVLFKAITEKRGENFGIRRPTRLNEIAAIADNLLLPQVVQKRLRHLRRIMRRSDAAT